MPYSSISLQSPEGLAEKAQVMDVVIPAPPDPMGLAEVLIAQGLRQEELIERLGEAYRAGDKDTVWRLVGELVGEG